MKLDRNINPNKMGKYAIVNLRRLDAKFGKNSDKFYEPRWGEPIGNALRTLDEAGVLEWGSHPEDEFFVMKLRDRYVKLALLAYAEEARKNFDGEYANEIEKLAERAGTNHPFRHAPD